MYTRGSKRVVNDIKRRLQVAAKFAPLEQRYNQAFERRKRAALALVEARRSGDAGAEGRQTESYRHSVLPPEALYDVMVVSTGTRRVMPARNLGPLTDEYSLTSDWDNQWLTGGLEADVIAEAHLDPDSIFAGIERFAQDRGERLSRQRAMLGALSQGA